MSQYKEWTVPATIEKIADVTDTVNALLEAEDCPMKAQMQVAVAIDELFSNIAHYAYAPGTGDAIIQAEITDMPRALRLTFIDSGKPYNPLARPDPDTTLSAEERGIGGLGIFLVRKTMSDMLYAYEDGKNKVTIIKEF